MRAGIICPVCAGRETTSVGGYKAKSALFQETELSQCSACDMIFASPMPTDESLAEYYQSYWEIGVVHSGQEALNVFKVQAGTRVDYITGKMGSLDGFRILDMGAGHGFFYDALLDRDVVDFTYTAVEVEIEARVKFERRGLRAHEDWHSLEDQTFDLVVMSHIVEHMPSPVDLLKDLGAVIGPKGIMFVEVPHHDHLHKQWLEPHLLMFNPKSLATLFESAGLRVVDLQTCGRPLMSMVPRSNLNLAGRTTSLARRAVGKGVRLMSNRRAAADPPPFDPEKYFQLNTYGKDRQWLRAIATKDVGT